MKKMNGREALLAAVTEAIEMLPLNFDIIDPDNPAPAPNNSATDEETIVGVMTENQKIIFTALQQARDALANADEDKDKTLEVAKFNSTAEVLKNLLFVSINNTFNVYERKGAGSGFRNNYEIVILPNPPDPQVMPFPKAFILEFC